MPLPLPNLDTRRWDDLTEEGRALIPRYARGWSDHNTHDPGITVLELLAWLVEGDIYRANQVPDRHLLKFLSLIDYPPRPPQAAQTIVTLSAPGVIPAETEFQTANGIAFRTLRDVTISNIDLAAVQVDSGDGTIRDHTEELRAEIPVEAFGHNPVPSSALYLGFAAAPLVTPISIYFKLTQPGGASIELVWEAFTGGSEPWTEVTPSLDDTESLTRDGFVELELPAATITTQLGESLLSLLYLRCRVRKGAYDATPVVAAILPNSVRAEQAIPARQSFMIGAGVTPAGPVPSVGDSIRFDTDIDDRDVIQSLTFLPAGTSNHPEVRVRAYDAPTAVSPGRLEIDLVRVDSLLPDTPLQHESLRVYTHQAGMWQEWTWRPDFDSSSRTDFHFTADATTGALRFGNGERGRRVPDSALVFASYRVTKAAGGNVAAGTIHNRFPATGGAAAEDIPTAASRAVAVLYSHDPKSPHPPTRAVNLQDYERIALHVPGTRVARAKAFAGVNGDYPCLRAPGFVTVVVIPDIDVPTPTPSPGLLRKVFCYLDRRRTLCTQVRVIGPSYVEVRIDARVRVRTLVDPARVRSSITAKLNAFLDPLKGGPDGGGWPFGRSVYRSEILQLIDNVSGVDYVIALDLVAGQGRGGCGNVDLCPGWLVTPGKHRIEVMTEGARDDN